MKDVEREDALDILSLLVERSLGFEKKKSCSDEKKETSSNFFLNDVFNSSESLVDVQKCLAYFCVLSNQQADENGPYDHDSRMEILDELEQCHVYSTKMKRAALSALTWLRSVGGSPSTSDPRNNSSIGKRNSHQKIF